MEQFKSELDKLLKALDKLEINAETVNKNKTGNNIELKKEFLNIRGKVSNLIQDFENS